MATTEYRNQFAKSFGIEWDQKLTDAYLKLAPTPSPRTSVGRDLMNARFMLSRFFTANNENNTFLHRATTSDDYPITVDKTEHADGVVDPWLRVKQLRAMTTAYQVLVHFTQAELDDLGFTPADKKDLDDFLGDTAHFRPGYYQRPDHDHQEETKQGLGFREKVIRRFEKYMAGCREQSWSC